MFRYLLLAFIALSLSAKAQKHKLYIADFQPNIKSDQPIGQLLAQDFEQFLSSCKSDYEMLRRADLPTSVNLYTDFNQKRAAMLREGIAYVLYGDISYNALSGKYVSEYYLEELGTSSIVLIEKITFDSREQLTQNDFRQNIVSSALEKYGSICKKIDPSKALPPTATANAVSLEVGDDTDRDGIPDLVDKEKNSSIVAVVDNRGKSLSDKQIENKDYIKPAGVSDKTIYKEMYPSLPDVFFLENSTELPENEHFKLHQVAMLLERYPLIGLVIEGTDEGDEARALQRAQIVKEYLIDNYQADSKRITLKATKASACRIIFSIDDTN